VTVDAFYQGLGLPEASRLDKRIFKRMVADHGQLTSADKRSLSQDVRKLTWRYTLKASTVQVQPYRDTEREYLEIAVVEVALNNRSRATRIAEMIQRAIPYPVLLVVVEGSSFLVSVAHKRFSLAEKGSVVAEDLLQSPWVEEPPSEVDVKFCEALNLRRLSQTDFHALYRSMVSAVLARSCAEFSGAFITDVGQPERERRRLLEGCHQMEREIGRLRTAIPMENQFADRVELNTRIKELERRLARATVNL
jgi:hypothetical protein